MTRERRLDGDLRRLRIADLPHHDLVRIVPQDRAQPAGKSEALFLVDGYLQHARQLVLDRVFDGDDLVAPGLRLGDGRVERRSLAAAGGSGDQQHAVGQRAQPAQLFDDVTLEAQHVQPQAAHLGERLLVEDTQHGIFAEDARDDRYAEVDRPSVHGDLEAPVLRDAPLGDIELGHHLDARDDLLSQLDAADGGDVRQHAVEAVAHHQPDGARLEVNVARAGAQGVVHGRVHQTHYRARVLADSYVGEVVDPLLRPRRLLRFGQHGVDRAQRLGAPRD